jgi:hypothetical protein
MRSTHVQTDFSILKWSKAFVLVLTDLEQDCEARIMLHDQCTTVEFSSPQPKTAMSHTSMEYQALVYSHPKADAE